MRVLIAAALALAPSPAQFDLVCSGITQGFPNDQPTTDRYRVDLTAKQFCRGASDCQIATIERVEPGILWFKESRRAYLGGPQWIEYVDRTSGKWFREMGPWVTKGTCEPVPFSGFPVRKTKF